MPKQLLPPPAFPIDHPEIQARIERTRRVAAAIPDTDVEEQNGHLLFLANGKRFGWLLVSHHGDGRLALNCKAERGANAELAAAHPDRYHLPAYVAHQGWLGLWMDQASVAWGEVERALAEARALSGQKGHSMPKSGAAKSEAPKKKAGATTKTDAKTKAAAPKKRDAAKASVAKKPDAKPATRKPARMRATSDAKHVDAAKGTKNAAAKPQTKATSNPANSAKKPAAKATTKKI